MLTKSRQNILLLLILVLAFLYRFTLLTWNTYPPGSDMGLHESVIKSITNGGGFFQNLYHMGGGVSATNPGFHIFTIAVIEMTGLPDYLAQSIVASLFSALIAATAFLFVRAAWGKSTPLIAAALVAFCGSDIAILIWGGYPNVITLMLIPVIFYWFLQRSRFSKYTYLATGSLLVGSMFLTHIFSALVFAAIALITLFAAALLGRKNNQIRSQVAYWLSPILLGILIVSPYLLSAVPTYFGTEGTVTNPISTIREALLETNLVSVNVVYLSLVPMLLFFLLSKVYKGKFFTIQAILSAAWVIVPALMTQAYLLGVYLVYARFVYFLVLPAIIGIALMINLGSSIFSRALGKLMSRTRKTGFGMKTSRPKLLPFHNPAKWKATSVFAVTIILLTIFLTPLFAAPNVGIALTNFYQVMTQEGYEAIEWIKANTTPGSICVADANFGWWVSGFSQRPTLSAIEPQNMILAHEFEVAKVAANILDLNHFIDNGLIRISQDDSDSANNHEFSAWINGSYLPYEFFSFRDGETDFIYRNGTTPSYQSFSQIPIVSTDVEGDSNSATFLATRENSLFTIIEETTLYRETRFAEVSITLQTKIQGSSFDWLHFYYQQRGPPIQYANSIAAVDTSMQVLSQIIFPEDTLGTSVLMRENPDSYELVYHLEGKSTAQIRFFVGLSQIQPYDANVQTSYLQELIFNNTQTYLFETSDLQLTFFNYKTEIQEWNVSYVIARDKESILRLSNESLFSLVFRNNEVSIFKVKQNAT
ncbi:MAG TPA: 6-pyruvoyl-tetrahydropterin synthase-related protein [Candidatus Bathyarchaeia archaeon]